MMKLNAATLVAMSVLPLWGCGGNKNTAPTVLVPAADGREATLTQLPADWLGVSVRALRASPGCLGAEGVQMGGGKRAVMAMFKDKAAAVEWYHNPAHQRLVGLVSPPHGHVALAEVADGGGPILVIATMVPAGNQPGAVPGSVLLSVELFKPLPGGVSYGGASAVGAGK